MPPTKTVISRKLRIDYRGFDSADSELKQKVSDALTPYLDLIPSWVLELQIINADEALPDNTVSCVVSEKTYRRAMITIGFDFYAQTAQDRSECILHELVHVLLAPVLDWTAERVLGLLREDNPDLHAALQAELTERCEGVVEELSFRIQSLLLTERKKK